MHDYSISPLQALEQFLRRRGLIRELIWRDVVGRYRGSMAGLFWSFLNPLFSLAMYTFVFGVILRARWGLDAENTFDFALILFAGLSAHALLCDSIVAAPALVLGNPAFVKQVVFPLEILPVVCVGSSIFHAAMSMLLLVVVWLIAHGVAIAALFFIPLLLAPLCLIALGCTWFLSAASVYFRDLDQVVGFLAKAMLFFSPIFYPASSVPESFRWLLQINPLTFVIENIRFVLIRGASPEPEAYLAYVLISFTVAWLGYICFQKSRGGFADVI
ncbi:MAG: ABC transporter permease [Methylococcales bacterium]